jgi:DNA-binding transcriptional regulator YdaS (Cro superfamily)
MSPRIIQLPMSGRDRRHFVRELRLAEQAHASLPGRVAEAYAAAHRLACEEWNVRQFIGGDAAPSPTIAEAIAAGRELLEVRCRRCGHESLVDLTEVIWPRERGVHTLSKALRCQACRDERNKARPDLVALRPRDVPDPAAPARRQRAR